MVRWPVRTEFTNQSQHQTPGDAPGRDDPYLASGHGVGEHGRGWCLILDTDETGIMTATEWTKALHGIISALRRENLLPSSMKQAASITIVPITVESPPDSSTNE
jgi:hypothetical protein